MYIFWGLSKLCGNQENGFICVAAIEIPMKKSYCLILCAISYIAVGIIFNVEYAHRVMADSNLRDVFPRLWISRPQDVVNALIACPDLPNASSSAHKSIRYSSRAALIS